MALLDLLTFRGVKKCGWVHTYIISIHKNQSSVVITHQGSFLFVSYCQFSNTFIMYFSADEKEIWHNTWNMATLLNNTACTITFILRHDQYLIIRTSPNTTIFFISDKDVLFSRFIYKHFPTVCVSFFPSPVQSATLIILTKIFIIYIFFPFRFH